MHLLLTRPESDSRALKMRLEAMGHRVSPAPLLGVDFSAAGPIALDGVQALVATSRNAIRAITRTSTLERARSLPLFAVGPATGAVAREAGFSRVIEGPAGAAELVPIIVAAAKTGAGPLLHLAGDQLAFDLEGALARHGLELRQVVVYRMRPAASLPASVADAIRGGTLDGVLLLSPRTAEIFVRLVTEAGLANAARRLIYVCMSEAVALALASLAPVNVNSASQPISEEVLALAARLTPESP